MRKRSESSVVSLRCCRCLKSTLQGLWVDKGFVCDKCLNIPPPKETLVKEIQAEIKFLEARVQELTQK